MVLSISCKTRWPLPFCAAVAALFLAGCASSVQAPHGQVKGERFSMQEMLQSDNSRLATLAMQENLNSLWLLAEKLYRRNPREWRKTAASLEAAVAYVRLAVLEQQGWHDLEDQHDVQALNTALSNTLVTAHGGKTRFTLVDRIHPQRVYNAARNVEIANWVLNTRRGPGGEFLLLSNHMGAADRNLSFEREMGKIIARLDLVASMGTEQVRRSAISFTQSLLVGPILPFLPVR
ncbi:hypothetical protein [uncultured Comamonas sp.]|uniref:hypothetical protein n=1 Tax=uncultured Comamonas sp. TaxID=114710 RepID=UPI002596D624|nr:hypothetical protein [uncultured Comamonas sp.]